MKAADAVLGAWSRSVADPQKVCNAAGACSLRAGGSLEKREEISELLGVKTGHCPGFVQRLTSGSRRRCRRRSRSHEPPAPPSDRRLKEGLGGALTLTLQKLAETPQDSTPARVRVSKRWGNTLLPVTFAARKTRVDPDSDLRVFKETASVFILEAFGRSDVEAPHDVALGFC